MLLTDSYRFATIRDVAKKTVAEPVVSELAAEGYPPLMLADDMCRLLRVSLNTLYARIKAGEVPGFTRTGTGKGSRYEWRRSDVEKWWKHRRLQRTA